MYCFVGDLAGFQNIVRNLSLEQQDVRIDQWVKLVESTASKCDLVDFRLISDMVIAITQEKPEGIDNLIKFSRILLEEGLQLRLPLRGAISQGDVKMSGQIAYGKALVDAYRLASNQNWLGVSIRNGVTGLKHLWDTKKLMLYSTPLKTGSMRPLPVVVWTIPPTKKLIELTLGEGLSYDGEEIGWDYTNKINNTVIFSLYLKLITETEKATGKKMEPSQIHVFTPLEVIEHKIDGHKLDFMKGNQ